MTDLDRLLGPDLVSAIETLIYDRVATALAAHPGSQPAPASPYLTVVEAADYLRCHRQRIDDLLSQHRLTRIKDGSRTLVRRDEIEHHLQHRNGRRNT